MKLIVAVIQSQCLEAVHHALNRDEARVISANGAVDDRYTAGVYRGRRFGMPRPRLRLEVVVNNDLAVRDAVAAIARAAGEVDGIVCVMPMDEVVTLPLASAANWSAEGQDPLRREVKQEFPARQPAH